MLRSLNKSKRARYQRPFISKLQTYAKKNGQTSRPLHCTRPWSWNARVLCLCVYHDSNVHVLNLFSYYTRTKYPSALRHVNCTSSPCHPLPSMKGFTQQSCDPPDPISPRNAQSQGCHCFATNANVVAMNSDGCLVTATMLFRSV